MISGKTNGQAQTRIRDEESETEPRSMRSKSFPVRSFYLVLRPTNSGGLSTWTRKRPVELTRFFNKRWVRMWLILPQVDNQPVQNIWNDVYKARSQKLLLCLRISRKVVIIVNTATFNWIGRECIICRRMRWRKPSQSFVLYQTVSAIHRTSSLSFNKQLINGWLTQCFETNKASWTVRKLLSIK